MVQLVVKEQSTSDVHYLDISDVSIKGNYSAKEIQDLSAQKSEFTQAFTLPFTSTNNKFFSDFYKVEVSEGSFDAAIKCEATIYVHSNVVFEGYLQLLNVNNSTEYYEAVVYGTISNIASSLGESKLNELDLSDFNHVLSYDNVVDSWDGNVTYTTSVGQTGSEILYPIIDYGYGYDNGNLTGPTATLMPARLKPTINVKVLFERILSSIGYKINSTFLATDFFAKQYMTIANEFQTVAYTFQDSFRVGLSSNQVISSTANLDLDDDTSTNPTGNFFDANGNFDTGAATPHYNVPLTGYYQFSITLGYEFSSIATTVATVYMKKLNDASFSQEITGPWNGSNYSLFDLSTGNQNIQVLSTYTPLYGGDEVYFEIYFSSATNSLTIYKDQTNIQLYLAPVSEENSTLDFGADNNIMPKDKQVDFISSICSRYNLIIEPDKEVPKQLNIEPAQDYFDAGSSVDWSNKLDVNKNVIIKPTNEYRKAEVNFKDLEDEDYLNTYWTDRERDIYNSYNYKLDGDFGQGELQIKTMFSSFCTDKVPGHDIIFGRFYKQEDGQKKYVKTKPKLFYYSGLKDCSDYKLWSQVSASSTTLDQYPFCHHYSMSSNMVTNSDEDIRFKSRYIFEQDFIVEEQPSNDVYSKCWRKYLNSIYSSESRVLIANFYLTPQDIATFNYNDKIFVENAYYRINKISSYSLGKNISTKVELLKIVDNNSNDSIIIAGCNLIYLSSSLDGTTNWLAPNGSVATPTQQCCEVNELTWYNNNCYWNIDTGPDGPTEPPIEWDEGVDVGTTGGVVLLGKNAQQIKTNPDGKTEIYLPGNIKQIGKPAGDGEVLTWSNSYGTTVWSTPAAGGSPAGSDKEIQFNDGGSFGADATFEYNKTTNFLTADNIGGKHFGTNIGLVFDLEMYLSPLAFKISSGYRNPPYTDDDGATIRPSSASINYYASFQVPIGYRAIKVDLQCSSNDSFSVHGGSWNSNAVGLLGSGTTNTELTLSTAFTGLAGKYAVIKFDPSSTTDELYGCKITLERV